MLSKDIRISGTDPTNPKSAADIVDRLVDMHAQLARIHEELGRLQAYAGSIRDVLHFDQSYPDKRASLVACEVIEEIKKLRAETESLHDRTQRTAAVVADCGVNLNARFTWRPTR